VECLTELAETAERARSCVRFERTHAPQLCEHSLIEMAGERGPLEHALIAVQPVDRLRISGIDGVHQVEHDVVPHELGRPKGVCLDLQLQPLKMAIGV
jgi:hypothetical protein